MMNLEKVYIHKVVNRPENEWNLLFSLLLLQPVAEGASHSFHGGMQ